MERLWRSRSLEWDNGSNTRARGTVCHGVAVARGVGGAVREVIAAVREGIGLVTYVVEPSNDAKEGDSIGINVTSQGNRREVIVHDGGDLASCSE